MKIQAFWDLNDNLLKVRGVKDISRDSFINDATGSVTLVDNTDTEITGQTWPLALAYVPNSDGDYQATLIDTLSTTALIGTQVTAKITIDGGAGFKGYWEVAFDVKTRTM